MKQKNKNLILLCIVFISLGLPDGLLGSGWPAIRETLGLSVNSIGLLTMLTFIGSFISSICYSFIASRFSVGFVIQTSTALVILGLILFSFATSSVAIFSAMFLLGIGAGGIDVAVNNYVGKHYDDRVMSWVHGFWGIGISSGSALIGSMFVLGLSWQNGYQMIALFELIILLLIWFNREDFKEKQLVESSIATETVQLKLKHFLTPLFYFFYGVEYVFGLYFSTFLMKELALSMSEAAFYVSFYWGSLMVGRFVTGFLTRYISSQKLLLTHLSIASLGALLLFSSQVWLVLVSTLLIGYGFSALYPVMMAQPYRYYQDKLAVKIVSYQVAFQTLGVIALPIFYGYLFKEISFRLLPTSIVISLVLMTLTTFIFYSTKKSK